jgi:integrase/recombinase XerD
MQSESVKLFLESVRSEITKTCYAMSLNKWMHFIEDSDIDEKTNPRVIESKLMEFLVGMKKKGMSYGAIRNYFTAVTSYYAINDNPLNVRKLSKFLPENKKVKTDRAYTREEISKLLEVSDKRMRVVILVFCSSGIRLGALVNLKLKHLDNYKLTVYEKDSEQYYTFITPECKEAIDSYLDMRSRYGEKLNDESFLIREQFDVRSIANPRPKIMQRQALQRKMYDLRDRAGIKKGEVSIVHGLRKFFGTQCANAKVDKEMRERLLGHKIGLPLRYNFPEVEEMYQEYQKAINNLTINEENRLKLEVQLLKDESNEIQNLKRQLNDHTAILSKFTELIELNRTWGTDPIVGNKEEFDNQHKMKAMSEDLQKKGVKAAKYYDPF